MLEFKFKLSSMFRNICSQLKYKTHPLFDLTHSKIKEIKENKTFIEKQIMILQENF